MFKLKCASSSLHSDCCFSCVHRADIDFVQYKEYLDEHNRLDSQEDIYNKAPWYRKLFIHTEDNYHFIRAWLSRFLTIVECRLNPKSVNKCFMSTCSHYKSRFPYGCFKNPMKMEDEITTIGGYIEYKLEQKSNG